MQEERARKASKLPLKKRSCLSKEKTIVKENPKKKRKMILIYTTCRIG